MDKVRYSWKTETKTICIIVKSHNEVLCVCFILPIPGIPNDPRGYRVLPSCFEITLFKNKNRHRSSLTWGSCFQFSGQHSFSFTFHPQCNSDNITGDAWGIFHKQKRLKIHKGFSSYNNSDGSMRVLLNQVPVQPTQRNPALDAVL